MIEERDRLLLGVVSLGGEVAGQADGHRLPGVQRGAAGGLLRPLDDLKLAPGLLQLRGELRAGGRGELPPGQRGGVLGLGVGVLGTFERPLQAMDLGDGGLAAGGEGVRARASSVPSSAAQRVGGMPIGRSGRT